MKVSAGKLSEFTNNQLVDSYTYLFRDRWVYRQYFSVVRDYVKCNNSINLLSVPCSTGQEPYSINALHKLFPKHELIIDAFDILGKNIDFAKIGVYEGIVPYEFISGLTDVVNLLIVDDRKFSLLKNNLYKSDKKRKIGEPWVVPKFLRNNINFGVKDFADINGENLYDIIFCRNFVYYFNEDGMNLVLSKLEDLVKPEGIVVLDYFYNDTGVDFMQSYSNAMKNKTKFLDKNVTLISAFRPEGYQ